jgi:hypothetical protein
MSSLDARALRVAGLGLLVVAAGFLWRDLQLDASLVVVLLAGGALVATVKGARGEVPWLAPVALGLTTAVSAGTWLALKDPVQLLGVAACVGAAGVLAHRTRALWATGEGAPLTEKGRLPALITWATLGLGVLALAGGGYFHLFTMHVDSEARRLVLSLLWVGLGLGFVFFARRAQQVAARDAGFMMLAVAVLKVLLYDTTHLAGGLRVGVLAAVGALLFAAGALAARPVRRVAA